MMTVSNDPDLNQPLRPVPAPKPTRTACVYCGSSRGKSPLFTESVVALGQAFAANAIRLVYGGGRVGLMGVVADATMQAGGEVIGIIPQHIHERELQHTGLTELLVVDTMHTRKRLMADRSQAFVIVPGGFGTLDECFEIITWKQLDLHDAPIIFLNIDGFWNKLIDMVDYQVETGFVSAENRKRLFVVADTVEQVIELLLQLDPHGMPMVEQDIR